MFKKFTFIIIMIIFAANGFAQKSITVDKKYNTTDYELYHIITPVDSLYTYATNELTFTSFNTDTTLIYEYSKVLTSAGMPKVTVYLQASYKDGNWFTIDSLTSRDSIKTYNRASKRVTTIAPTYRLYVVGNTGNRRDTQLEITLFAYKRKYR